MSFQVKILLLSFVTSVVISIIVIPILRKLKVGQSERDDGPKSHLNKKGTPTMGGIIFIIPVILSLLFLYIRGSISLNHNLIIVVFVFLSYALLGFVDDFLKVRYHNNDGLRISTKFLLQMCISLIFFYIFMKNGGEPTIEITFLHLTVPLGWTFGLFILFILVGTSNAVNITDGLDGLCAGLSVIAFLAFGILSWNAAWMEGSEEVAIFCFVLVGSLLGFLVFNSHPARVFMGDLGSLSLGAAMATIAIITRHELSLVLIGGVFVVETLSSMIQIIAIRKFNRKVFLMAPLHHHFEQLGWSENDIVKLFYIVGLLLAMAAITYGVWL